MATTSAPVYPANAPIPFDLFVSKKHRALPRGVLGFADSSGNIVFKVNRQDSKSSFSHAKAILLDSAGNPLISLYPHNDGSWQGFKGDDGDKDLIFKVQRVLTKFTRTELEVYLVSENQGQGELTCDFKVIGCHFQRSCTIYKGDSIVAQHSKCLLFTTMFTTAKTAEDELKSMRRNSEMNSAGLILHFCSVQLMTSLMHKLRKICVSRSKFRLTMFPSLEDPSLVVALVREPLKNPKLEGEVVSSLLGILCDGVDCLVSGDHADEFKDYFSKIRMEREMAATMKVFDGGWSAIIVGG
ncbi:hypothetical protein CXB51_009454 [Gossypium anomalum]|uniref:Protein LURP-one-related 7 n=1 Tax=Gossypium anomalum TaxID=47600 RepID=A0A8J5ZDQ8_9ROSI|nr:hypothetical protein CXB51_009454 [Gossypium anomalum]